MCHFLSSARRSRGPPSHPSAGPKGCTGWRTRNENGISGCPDEARQTWGGSERGRSFAGANGGVLVGWRHPPRLSYARQFRRLTFVSMWMAKSRRTLASAARKRSIAV